jgi:phosphoesterase RecJ-like protein
MSDFVLEQDHVDQFSKCLNSFLAKKNLQVYSHIRPDGDSIGSQIALVRVLKSLGADVSMVLPPEIPAHLLDFIGDTPVSQPSVDATVIVLDCSSLDRVTTYSQDIQDTAVIFNFDHHKTNSLFARENMVYPDACSTTHALATFFRKLDYFVDSITATALYLGIYTDTGQFKYSRTNSSVFDICSWLCQKGVNPEFVANTIFNQNTLEHYQVQNRFVDTIELELDGRFSLGVLSHKDFLDNNLSPSPTNRDCAELLRTIRGVIVSAYIEEFPDGDLKCSLRSNHLRYPVDAIAVYYGGGGHPQAAGVMVSANLQQFKEELKGKILELLDSVDAK